MDEGEICGLDVIQQQPGVYAAPSSTDVNGDGLADLCARGGGGLRCWLATPGGWPEEWAAIPWADESGWADVTNYATLRMGDLDGDGLADACARADAGLVCALSNGTGFEPATLWHAGVGDAEGGNAPARYATLRLADVDGDGRDDLCARDADGFDCWISDGAAFGREVPGPRWSDAAGWHQAKHYATIRMGDVDGDGGADVCGRSDSGVECWLSSGDGFAASVEGPAWAGGDWGEASRWSTIRLLDYDGDGRSDLCARVGEGIECARSLGTSFDPPVLAVSLGGGWDDPSNYMTLRAGDLDGDGADDLCLRSNTSVFCIRWNGAAFDTVDGPAWSDDAGWGSARYHQTIRLADFDGDGRDDLCGRASAGWRCHPSNGDGFDEAAVFLDELTDAGNWDEPQYWSTILSAGRACRASTETCNGQDDDCDGATDEGVCDGRDARTGDAGARDAGARSDAGPDAASTSDAGEGPTLTSGCGCRTSGGSTPLGSALFVALCALVRHRRRRAS